MEIKQILKIILGSNAFQAVPEMDAHFGRNSATQSAPPERPEHACGTRHPIPGRDENVIRPESPYRSLKIFEKSKSSSQAKLRIAFWQARLKVHPSHERGKKFAKFRRGGASRGDRDDDVVHQFEQTGGGFRPHTVGNAR